MAEKCYLTGIKKKKKAFKRRQLAVKVQERKKETEVGKELEFPAEVCFAARAGGAWLATGGGG